MSEFVYNPDQFIWGAATSSHQIEGYNHANDWWAWEAKGVVDGGVRSGAATDHLNRFKEDLALAKRLGLDSYRFSFEWSRFEPSQGEWREEAVAWYGAMLDECDRLGLMPMATLHHFTSPQWFAERGGFAHEGSPELFMNFVRKIVTEFGSRIPLWCTLNEPLVLVVGGYMGRFMPPGEFNPKNAVRACTNLLKCHVMAYDYLKANIKDRTGPFREVPLQVGFAHNMIHFVPDRPMHPIENVLAASVSSLYNDAWLNAVNGGRQRFGLLGIMPFAPQVQMALGRRSYDFIGVNYYTRARVQWRPRAQMKESSPQVPVGVIFAKRREVASDLGWPISARGLRLLLQKVKRYKAPVYITENGIADADDLQRRRYILSHLREIARARADGLEIRGYYHWSLIDNFEWIKGFWPRFGLVAIDYETFERKPRRSFDFLRDLISAHRTESADHGPLTAVLDEFEPFT